jgi:hypothetical protein
MAASRTRVPPPKPLALHLQQGTWRISRHGPRPPKEPLRSAPVVPAARPSTRGPIASGAALETAIRTTWAVDDVVGQVYAQTAGQAFDRGAAVDALLDGPTGLLARLAAGEKGVSAKAVEVLLKAQRQAGEELITAIDRLELDPEATRGPRVGTDQQREAS